MGDVRMWRREGSAPGNFAYVAANGRQVVSEVALRRVRKLAIPPGWRDVLIDPRPGAKIQAVGIDVAGRKQYRYHPDFVSQRAHSKVPADASVRALPAFAPGDDERTPPCG